MRFGGGGRSMAAYLKLTARNRFASRDIRRMLDIFGPLVAVRAVLRLRGPFAFALGVGFPLINFRPSATITSPVGVVSARVRVRLICRHGYA